MITRYAVGLMSGTSLDGIDAALVEISGSGIDTELELIGFSSLDIPEEVRERILQASHIETSNVALICELNVQLGDLFSQAVGKVVADSGFVGKLDFVASHGQTIHHLPQSEYPSTLQIGDPSQIAYDHNVTVVFNFRMMDMIAGGDGAPLVPYSEYVLYTDKEKSRLLQNIGGIGNVTVLPKGADLISIRAFDTGPGNMMMNAAVKYYYNELYDKDGLYAKKGTLIPELYESLCSEPFLKIVPPKSTGRELFGEGRVKTICDAYDNANDVIHTLTKFTAYTIAQSYRDFVFPHTEIDEIIVGGGGAYNPVLMDMIRTELPEYTVIRQEDLGYSSDAKEAIAFAILGNETLHNKPSNVPSATGAKTPVILGQIQPKPISE